MIDYICVCNKCGRICLGSLMINKNGKCIACKKGNFVKTIEVDFDDYIKSSKEEKENIKNQAREKVQPLDQYDPEAWQQRLDAEAESKEDDRKRKVEAAKREAFGVKCPSCGSFDYRRIGNGERVVSTALFGVFSKKIGKTYKCNHCGCTW